MGLSEALHTLAAGAVSILGRDLEPRELEAFSKYLGLLRKWQTVHRLVGSVEPEWVVENLFLDSLLFLGVLPDDVVALADLGSGAGFPGLPIKIVRPQLEVALIEARQHRVSFLSTVIRELALSQARVVSDRAEHISGGMVGSFEAVVMRCAGDPARVLPEARRLLAPGGVAILSGPPTRRPLASGEWIEMPGVRPGRRRLFFVCRT